jgi:hypothetical protein
VQVAGTDSTIVCLNLIFDVQTVELILEGQKVSPTEAHHGRQSCAELRQRLEGLMAHYQLDAWIAPAATGPPPLGLGERALGFGVWGLGF